MASTTTNGLAKNTEITTRIDTWLAELRQSRSKSEVDFIARACELARTAHHGQKRASGEPYLIHSLAVAQILEKLHLDYETLAAAVLHDVIEDTEIDLEDVRQQFGETTAKLVDGVTKMAVIQGTRNEHLKLQKEHTHVENLRKMLLAMAEDVRVVLIKLADRLHNMRTMDSLDKEKQQRIASETMDIFAPLANRLGIWQIKWELEDLAFRYLQTQDYQQIVQTLSERPSARERFIEGFINILKKALREAGIQAEVKGRAKHIYGIWKKMQRSNLDFHQINDVRAVRILVNEIPDCYAALGIVHTLWQYLPGEFDDYIATPKENNYRSLHTAVIGPEGKTVEVQIRTHDMHRDSEYGVAAHWRYKEGARTDAGFDSKIAWLRQLLDWKNEVAGAGEFVDQFKSEVFSDRVYVFTPKGNVIDLPRGATPLDFAYHIHTEVGHRCRGAKVNGHIAPLTYPLNTGEQVNVLTVKSGGPSRDWLNPHLGYLVTSKARAQVKHWFRSQNHERNVADGRALLDREFKRLGLVDIKLEKLAQKLKQKSVDELMAAIGRGDIKPTKAVNAAKENIQPIITESISRGSRSKASQKGIRVQGVGDLLTRIAGCCKPVPGDPIMGFITRDQGVSIHRQDCHNILRSISDAPERLVEVDWGDTPIGTYSVDIEIVAFDRQGLLRDISTLFTEEKINVVAVHTESNKKYSTAYMVFTVEITDLDILSRVLARINQLPNVTEIKRKSH